MTAVRSLWKPLLVGLLVRELLSFWTGHPFDFEIWVRLGVYMQSWANPYSILPSVPGVSFAPYPLMTSISYPPLPAFIFAVTYALYHALGSPSAYLYYFLLKQPMVVSDALIAVVLFRLASLGGDPERARRIAVLWLFFPFAVIVSSMWGALDPTALLLILLSVYAFRTERRALSAVLLGVSIYYKLMPVIFLPVFLLHLATQRRRMEFASISLSIPLVGTLLPILTLGWGFSGITNAVSYQGSLPVFGGMGVFSFLSLWAPPSGIVTQILGWVWLLALLAAYVISYRKRLGLVESLLVSALLFSVFRPVTPEQWALYPLSFLLLSENARARAQYWGVAAVATGYLLVNNFLLVRFYSPLSTAAFNWDQFVDGASAISDLRYALLLVLSTFFVAEALSVVVQRGSFLRSKLSSLRSIGGREIGVALGYVGVVSVAGGVLDYTATKMVTDWALAIQSDVFLGLSWLSLYHIMLVTVFETLVVLVVLFSRRDLSESISLFLLLTFLNFVASGVSLTLYLLLEGAPVLATTKIFLVGSSSVTERAFVVFATTLGFLGVFYLREIRTALLIILRRSPATGEGSDAFSLPPAP